MSAMKLIPTPLSLTPQLRCNKVGLGVPAFPRSGNREVYLERGAPGAAGGLRALHLLFTLVTK
jgi:hypothetical protein